MKPILHPENRAIISPIPDTGRCVCRVCNRDMVRVPAGVNAKGARLWKDATGRQWSGRMCPDCNAVRSRSHKRSKGGPRTQYDKYCTRCRRSGAEPLPEERWRAIHYA
jgi:hypothetical protein